MRTLFLLASIAGVITFLVSTEIPRVNSFPCCKTDKHKPSIPPSQRLENGSLELNDSSSLNVSLPLNLTESNSRKGKARRKRKVKKLEDTQDESYDDTLQEAKKMEEFLGVRREKEILLRKRKMFESI